MEAEHVKELNILSNRASAQRARGPEKVYSNLLKALSGRGIVEINGPLSGSRVHWVHDRLESFLEACVNGRSFLFGPNLVSHPFELPRIRPRLKNTIALVPSDWVAEMWRKSGFQECLIEVWPAPINMRLFDDFGEARQNSKNVLVYCKRRDPRQVEQVFSLLKTQGFNPILIRYGYYQEAEFLHALRTCRFGVWMSLAETQGLALQEALSTDLPLLVWDVRSAREGLNPKHWKFHLMDHPATAAPYFDSRCGLKVYSWQQFEEGLAFLADNLHSYAPRKFIESNLSESLAVDKFLNLLARLNPAPFSRRHVVQTQLCRALSGIDFRLRKWNLKRRFQLWESQAYECFL